MEQVVQIRKPAYFLDEVSQYSGVDVCICSQCTKCTAGCPVAYAADYSPAQIIHAIQLGLANEVLTSEMIWLCASCEICSVRCPQGIDIVRVMDALKGIALEAEPGQIRSGASAFYAAAWENIRIFGRMYEPALGLQSMLYSKQYRHRLSFGFALLRKRKLRLLPGLGSFRAARKAFSGLRSGGRR
jgi:heterodisulfide reductase subunit C2